MSVAEPAGAGSCLPSKCVRFLVILRGCCHAVGAASAPGGGPRPLPAPREEVEGRHPPGRWRPGAHPLLPPTWTAASDTFPHSFLNSSQAQSLDYRATPDRDAGLQAPATACTARVTAPRVLEICTLADAVQRDVTIVSLRTSQPRQTCWIPFSAPAPNASAGGFSAGCTTVGSAGACHLHGYG